MLNAHEREQLAETLGCDLHAVDEELKSYTDAATEEFVRMILGQKVFTRGQDIREYRLFLIIKHVYRDRLPSEEQVSTLFQTTTSQSRSLLRAVLSKYQYELQPVVAGSLSAILDTATQASEGASLRILCDSVNVIEALNRRIAKINGKLMPITKAQGTIGSYEITVSSHAALIQALQ